MKRIETFQQLNEERRWTKQKIARLELLIENDIAEIKAGLQPWSTVGHTVKSMVSSEKDGVFSESIGLTIDALIKKILLRKSGWISKLVISFLAKNYAKNLLAKNAEGIIGWIAAKIRPGKEHSKEYYHESTGNIDWDE